MQLSAEETAHFYKLHHSILAYANRRLEVVPDFDHPDDAGLLVAEERVQIRDALHENLSLLKDFLTDNPYGLSADELAIVASWQHRVAGNFFIVRYLKKYTVLLGTKPERLYGGERRLIVGIQATTGTSLRRYCLGGG